MISVERPTEGGQPSNTTDTAARPTRATPTAWLHALARPLTRQPAHVWMVLGLMGLGLVLRVWMITVNQLEPVFSPADDGDYYHRALRFATTGQYIDDFWLIRPPLHVFLFALMLKIGILFDMPGIPLIRAAQTGMLLLTIPLGFGIARRLFNNVRAGLVMAFILAVWFPFVELPVHLFSEPTFFFFLVLHIWLLVRWRDERHWKWLVAAGVALGFGTLARSPTVYGGVFVAAWLVLEHATSPGLEAHKRLTWRPRSWLHALRPHVLRPVVIFAISCAVIVLPWTLRNYLVYDRFILVDTIGSVNLWLHIEQYDEHGVETLKPMPQADRHIFAMEDTRRIFWSDPQGFLPLLFRNAGFHFMHIWKAQFVEDFGTKASFFGRPLREFWLLGAFGDLLWFSFTLAGLVALTTPWREGWFRLVPLGWLAYTIFAMMIMHIEPRYLLPVWLMLIIYGAWMLAAPREVLALLRAQPWHGTLALTVALVFLAIFFSYRNYPEIIGRSIQREQHLAAGMQAYANQDYNTATHELRAAVEINGTFTETRANLALVLAAQGEYDEAWRVLGSIDAQRVNVVRGMLERAQGDAIAARDNFVSAETSSGENVQQFALQWLPAPATTDLQLGNGRDLGYVAGFWPGEEEGGDRDGTYRWLLGGGQMVLPLPQPLEAGSVVALRMTSGQASSVPLTVGFADGTHHTITVQGGDWRVYRLAVPPMLAGESELALTLDAPTFVPAHHYPDSIDTRALSLMISQIRVK